MLIKYCQILSKLMKLRCINARNASQPTVKKDTTVHPTVRTCVECWRHCRHNSRNVPPGEAMLIAFAHHMHSTIFFTSLHAWCSTAEVSCRLYCHMKMVLNSNVREWEKHITKGCIFNTNSNSSLLHSEATMLSWKQHKSLILSSCIVRAAS